MMRPGWCYSGLGWRYGFTYYHVYLVYRAPVLPVVFQLSLRPPQQADFL